MSGYTTEVIAPRGVLEEGIGFIHKPFSIKDLAVKVRAALEQERNRRLVFHPGYGLRTGEYQVKIGATPGYRYYDIHSIIKRKSR